MMKDKIMEEVEQNISAIELHKQKLLDKGDFLDDDGYPTEDALEIISIWHWNDPKGWFKFIEEIWYMPSWGWREYDEPHPRNDMEQYKDRIVHKYNISTAGWSGNESIIYAMQENRMMWCLNWEQSRRGGHYIFELREVT
jgi:hypothetical protein